MLSAEAQLLDLRHEVRAGVQLRQYHVPKSVSTDGKGNRLEATTIPVGACAIWHRTPSATSLNVLCASIRLERTNLVCRGASLVPSGALLPA